MDIEMRGLAMRTPCVCACVVQSRNLMIVIIRLSNALRIGSGAIRDTAGTGCRCLYSVPTICFRNLMSLCFVYRVLGIHWNFSCNCFGPRLNDLFLRYPPVIYVYTYIDITIHLAIFGSSLDGFVPLWYTLGSCW